MGNDRFNTKKLALCAVMTALMVVLVYMSSLFPVMSLSIIAVAGVISAVLVSECGPGKAILAYVASSVLMMLLVPDKGNAVLFVLLFGIYPAIAEIAERAKHKCIVWSIKIIVSNLLFVLTWYIFCAFAFIDKVEFQGLIWIVWIAFNVLFVMYDICLKKLVLFYKFRIARYIQ